PHQHQHHRPLRRLVVSKRVISTTDFNIYKRYHFDTLERIDISFNVGSIGAWTVQVLTSCPSLQRFKSRIITAQEIIDSGTWVCRGLQKFSVMIDMNFEGDCAPHRKFTEHELDQCRAVFKKLASLKNLRVLDMVMSKEKHMKWELFQDLHQGFSQG